MSVDVFQSVHDNGGDLDVAQCAVAMAGIEVFREFRRELADVHVLRGFISGLRIHRNEGVSRGKYWTNEALEQRIGQAKRDKDWYPALLPVGRFVPCLLDIML